MGPRTISDITLFFALMTFIYNNFIYRFDHRHQKNKSHLFGHNDAESILLCNWCNNLDSKFCDALN